MKNKLKVLTIIGLCGVFSIESKAQSEVDIKEVEVNAARSAVKFDQAARNVTVISKEEIESSPARNLNELLEFVGNVDVRQRGQNGVQADISMRGSSFEQVLILLNGVKMTDPQTGHHNMNLPIALIDIERIEILHGGAARIYGPGAFAGAINIITKNASKSMARLQILGGQNGLQQYGMSATVAAKNQSHRLSWQQQNSDGFIRNTDFTMNNIFWQSEVVAKNNKWMLNLGQNEKAFGAQNFYTSRFPEQFEKTKTQFVSFGSETSLNKLKINSKAYYRKHNDRFELFREGEDYFQRLPQGGFANKIGDTISWYSGHNYHQTQIYGAELNLTFKSVLGKSSVGFDFRREEILSNVLGNRDEEIEIANEHPSAMYLKGEDRENRSVYVEHNYVKERLYVSAGAILNMNSAFVDKIYPGVDVSYQIGDAFRPYASYNRSFRFPTYTDLYYRLGGVIGSEDLKAEDSDNYEIGLKYNNEKSYGHAAVFRREGDNLIDWIRFTGSPITQAANLTDITIDGIEIDYVLTKNSFLSNLPLINQIRLSYSYLESSDKSTGFESNYVLDFLRHKADASIGFKIAEPLYLDWNFSYQDRVGEYVNKLGEEVEFAEVLISDLKVSVKNAAQKDLDLFLQVSNVFDREYVDIGNVQNPGRWVSVGLNYQFGINTKKKQ